MNRLNACSESHFLKIFFAFLTAGLFVAAFILPDRGEIFDGVWRIMCSTVKAPTNVFDIAGFAPSFFNTGIVCAVCTGLFFLPKVEANAPSVLGFLLTLAFGFWGVNLFNLFFGMLGVLLYCLVKRQNPASQVNTMLYSTALAPLYSDLLFRYPDTANHDFSWDGFLFALGAGILVGFFLPAGLTHSPKLHKGFSIYSAAIPLGFTAFFLRVVLYAMPEIAVPPTPVNEHTASLLKADVFCGLLFAFFLILGVLMGGLRPFLRLLRSDGHQRDFIREYGNAVFLMNVGTYGLFILLVYNLIGAEFNAITLGCVFAMLASCCSGSHVRNVLPLSLGYIVISVALGLLGYELTVNHQTVVVGLCFVNCLSPIAGQYGFVHAMAASIVHYILVWQVPALHGGFLLYNGGFTSGLVCIILVPIFEHFFRTREERNAKKTGRRRFRRSRANSRVHHP